MFHKIKNRGFFKEYLLQGEEFYHKHNLQKITCENFNLIHISKRKKCKVN